MSASRSGGGSLERLADAILLPPFPGLRPPAWLLAALGRGLGGVTLFGSNVSSPEELSALTATLRGATGTEPVLAIDEEGGDVTRLAHAEGSSYPGNAALGAVDDVRLTRAVYRALGDDLAAVGVNVDLAPSVDVNTAAGNPVIGTRSFGADPVMVARHAAAAVVGLQSAGVAACAKHFPGHGSTSEDSHHVMAMVEGDMTQVRERDLPPFAAAVQAGCAAVMPGHLLVPGLTGDLPATHSSAALEGLLRGELGFTGVIISDALEMRAVSQAHGIGDAAVRAVAAGVDLLCLGRDQDEEAYLAVRTALVVAVTDGALPAGRLADAAQRADRFRAMLAAKTLPEPGEVPGATPAQLVPGSAGGVGDASGAEGIADTSGAEGVGEASRAESAAAVNGADPARASSSARDGVNGAVPAARAPEWAEVSGQADGVPKVAGGHVDGIGLAAARRALRISGPRSAVSDPVVVQFASPGNIAVGSVPWGLRPWLPVGSVIQVPTGGGSDPGALVAEAVKRAVGRSLVAVVRDAHRDPGAQAVLTQLLTERPDTVVVEMGLPIWRPPAQTYVATYGASRTSGQAAAEVLGLTEPGAA